ncbi:MAG: phospholipase effector Tle1 domain-containing protein [Hyphomicrobiales bacterium]
MSKLILIFSDGTGQVGGMRPDQRLSNVYKMYRAMRPGPASPIKWAKQVAFYDAGLGAGETGGITFKRVRNFFAATVGSGIDENIIDCYEAIIAAYEPGDEVCIFGFSRGAYTARCVANVMNHCGIPTSMPGGVALPRHGPELRKIASDAVRYVYNYGAGKDRGKYDEERLEKAERFRKKYSSEDADGKPQGNVQPIFVGVFDTVAALGSRKMQWAVQAGLMGVGGLCVASFIWDWSWWFKAPLALTTATILYWLFVVLSSQFKYVRKKGSDRPRWWNPISWRSIKSWHWASWNLKHYDKYLDRDVRFARHAISIDEARKSFPRVGWGAAADFKANASLKPAWMKQVWFPGNHSDIGGSYPENESRLSDIALKWMIDELKEAVPNIQIRNDLMQLSPDPHGLQHDEIVRVQNLWPSFVPHWLRQKLTWGHQQRPIRVDVELHDSVLKRMKADNVPVMGEVKPYRPAALRTHEKCKHLYSEQAD